MIIGQFLVRYRRNTPFFYMTLVEINLGGMNQIPSKAGFFSRIISDGKNISVSHELWIVYESQLTFTAKSLIGSTTVHHDWIAFTIYFCITNMFFMYVVFQYIFHWNE